jgi:hypothetical protein
VLELKKNMHAHTNACSHPNAFLSIYGNKKNKRSTRLVIGEHVMSITIFYKEEDERNILIFNCEEGMEETYVVATSSLLVFFL